MFSKVFSIVLLGVVLPLHSSYGQLIANGLTAGIEIKFHEGFESVPVLASTFHHDQEFHLSLHKEVKALEVEILRRTVAEKVFLVYTKAGEIPKDKDRNERLDILAEDLSNLNFIESFKENHQRPQTMLRALSTNIKKSLPSSVLDAKMPRAFLEGLDNSDEEITQTLMDYVLPTPTQGHRSKRQITTVTAAAAWACRLLRVSKFAGMNHERVAKFITRWVPIRWRGQMLDSLAHGGSKRLLQLAGVLCGVSSFGSVAGKLFNDQDEAPLIFVYERAFQGENGDVTYEAFRNFAQWMRAAVSKGFEAAGGELVQMRDVVIDAIQDRKDK